MFQSEAACSSCGLGNYTSEHIPTASTVEVPDAQIDRIIRSVQANQGKLTNVLAKEMPVLAEPGIWSAIVETVERAFTEQPVF